MLGLVYLWDLVREVEAYFEFDSDLTHAEWLSIMGQIAGDVQKGVRPPDLRLPLGPCDRQ